MTTAYIFALFTSGAMVLEVVLGQWDRAAFFAVLSFWNNWNLRYFLRKDSVK